MNWNGKNKALTLSYDDGVESDVRLVEILNRYGVKCTFNLNSGIMTPESRWVYNGFEVRRMRKEDIKRFLALYYDASMSGEQMPDIDGEQFYVLPDNE